MPVAWINALADKTGKSDQEIEKLYKKAKEIVKKEYKIDDESDKFYKLVYGVMKKMLKLEEDLSIHKSIHVSSKYIESIHNSISESIQVNGKSLLQFMQNDKDDPTDLDSELEDEFKVSSNKSGRIVLVYANLVKKKKYKSTEDAIESIDNILKGSKGSFGE